MKFAMLSLAGGLLLASASVASAAPATVTNDLNLRSGPGTGYAVVAVLPGGSIVNAYDCGGNWCRVSSAEGTGYASTSYLDVGGGAYAYEPGPVVVAPGYAYDWGPDWGWGPGIGFGFGGGGHGGWHGGGHWHHH